MADLSGGELLTQITNLWPRLGILLAKHETAINTVAQNAAVATDGEMDAPAQPGRINVKVAGEMAHFTIDDPQELQRGAQYHLEIANNPQFSAPHVVHLGSTRGHFMTLPTNDDSGVKHNWYVRGYSQYQGSQPSAFTYYGGNAPVAFQMAGATNMTPLASTGSGTASNNGQQGGWGLGKTIYRTAPAPKRNVGG